MDTRETYRTVVKRALEEYAAIPYSFGDLAHEVVFDEERARYLVLTLGWEGRRRIHGVVIHIDILGDKIWIQEDNTEAGIATDLLAAGIPKEHIVLGFHSARVRPYTEFAVA